MVTVSVDKQDKLKIGQVGGVAGFEIVNSIAKKILSSFRIL